MIVLSWARRRLAPFFALPWVPKSLIGLVTFLALLVIATLPYVPERQVLRAGGGAHRRDHGLRGDRARPRDDRIDRSGAGGAAAPAGRGAALSPGGGRGADARPGRISAGPCYHPGDGGTGDRCGRPDGAAGRGPGAPARTPAGLGADGSGVG